MKLKNPAILITGATRRIGLELAKKSLTMGYDVVLHHRSDRREADAWLAANPAFRRRVAFVRQDVNISPASIVDAAGECAPALEGLVNSAAVFTRGNLDNLVHFHATLATNTFAPLALCQRFAALRSGRWIINITDAHCRPINLSWQNYRLSKLFLEELTRQLAVLLAPRIRVNAIAPGAVLPSEGGLKEFKRIETTLPLKRSGTVDSILQAYEFVVRNGDITGEIIHVDGGWHLTR
jgi:NAD(P)-dependent dehydrogenase (short-subunit alcohol dehydrogenase family)